MNEQPPSIASLKTECHQLIERVSYRPGAIKLLLGCRLALAIYATYKTGRNRFVDFSKGKKNG